MQVTFEEASGQLYSDATVQSVEGGLYVAELVHESGSVILVDANGRRLIHRCLEDAKSVLRELGIKAFDLVQLSAYDEMVGQPAKVDNALRLRMNTKPAGA